MTFLELDIVWFMIHDIIKCSIHIQICIHKVYIYIQKKTIHLIASCFSEHNQPICATPSQSAAALWNQVHPNFDFGLGQMLQPNCLVPPTSSGAVPCANPHSDTTISSPIEAKWPKLAVPIWKHNHMSEYVEYQRDDAFSWHHYMFLTYLPHKFPRGQKSCPIFPVSQLHQRFGWCFQNIFRNKADHLIIHGHLPSFYPLVNIQKKLLNMAYL